MNKRKQNYNKTKIHFSSSKDVEKYINSPAFFEEVKADAYLKYLDGCNDSEKNWLDAENQIYAKYYILMADLYIEELDDSMTDVKSHYKWKRPLLAWSIIGGYKLKESDLYSFVIQTKKNITETFKKKR